MSEKFTYNQVNQQESSAYINGSKVDPSVLVRRNDGRITVGRLNKDTRDVHFTEDGQAKYKPNVSIEALSDQYQEQLAVELSASSPEGGIEETEAISRSRIDLGGEALEAVGVREPSAAENQLNSMLNEQYKGLSDADRSALWFFAAALHPHEEDAARNKMSPELRSDTARQNETQKLMRELSQLRNNS